MIADIAGATDNLRAELWWCALGAGVVVVACVIILLTLLSAHVRDIEVRLRQIAQEASDTSTHLADSTAIPEAAERIKDLADQLAIQAAVVTQFGGATP